MIVICMGMFHLKKRDYMATHTDMFHLKQRLHGYTFWHASFAWLHIRTSRKKIQILFLKHRLHRYEFGHVSFA